MDRPKTFDPNTNEHLIWTLKLAYKYSCGDLDVSADESSNALCDALCNLIGNEEFCKFVEEENQI